MDLETRLARVESIEQIRAMKARYCDLCDEGYDADALCELFTDCLLYTSPSPRDGLLSRMPSSA